MFYRTLQILLLSMMLVAFPGYAATYKIATISPDGLSWMKKLRAGVKEISARTEGRVKFKIYPGGVQGDEASEGSRVDHPAKLVANDLPY